MHNLIILLALTNMPFWFKGAKVLTGGKRHSLGMTFFEPTVITGVNSDMLLSRYKTLMTSIKYSIFTFMFLCSPVYRLVDV